LLQNGNRVNESFPKTVFISIAGSGENSYLSASETEKEAIAATDDGLHAEVAEYRRVSIRKRQLHTAVIDADESESECAQ